MFFFKKICIEIKDKLNSLWDVNNNYDLICKWYIFNCVILGILKFSKFLEKFYDSYLL